MATESAKVTITGTPEKPVFNFVIPSGAKGERGVQGIVGPTPNLKVGEVNTLTNPSDAEWIAGMIRKSPEVTAALTETFPSTMKGEKGEKGDGGIPVANLVVDLDNYRSDGYYKMEAGATDIKNLPPDLTQKYGTLSVLTTNGVNRLEQVFYPTASSQGGKVFFIRTLAGNLWSPWRTVSTQRVDNTAGRTIYTWDETANRDQLIYGDTGWRRIPIPAASMIADTFLSIRRVGGMVTIAVFRSQIVAPNSGDFVTIPNGFRTGITLQTPVAIGDSSVAPCQITSSAENNLRMWWSGATGWLSFTITYPTNDAWPTTLPGTAIGSIPSN